MAGKTYHMCIDVKGVLSRWKMKDFRNLFRDESGRTLTPQEAKDHLIEELSKGHNFIPCGECDNFDHAEHGCMGHDWEG